jgi:chlorite dismutase
MSVPSTLEGSFMLHLMVDVDWNSWNEVKSKRRQRLMDETGQMLSALCARGDKEESGAIYHLFGHKGDLLWVFARKTSRELAEIERALTQLPIWPYLNITDSYYSVVELSLHGVAERNRTQLQKQGLEEGTPEWDQGTRNHSGQGPYRPEGPPLSRDPRRRLHLLLPHGQKTRGKGQLVYAERT